MSWKRPLQLTELEQVRKILDKVDVDNTPLAEKPIHYLTIGILEAEFHSSQLQELELETADRIFSEKRVSEIRRRAIDLLASYSSTNSAKGRFASNYVAGLAANATFYLLGGLLALVFLLGNLEGVISALELLRDVVPSEP